MDTEQKNLIQKHLPALLELTNCNDSFLSRFTSKNILDTEDVEDIETTGQNHGQIRKSKIFYKLIQTRVGSFEVLLEALESTRQTGALEMLGGSSEQLSKKRPLIEDGTCPEAKSAKSVRFSEPPDYITNFLSDANKTVLVVNTVDSEITCDRIYETSCNCRRYNYEEFLGFISSQTSVNRNDHIPVVSCTNNISSILRHCKRFQGKVIIVGRFDAKTTDPTHVNVTDKIQWNDLSPIFEYQIQKEIKAWFDLESSEYSTELEYAEPELMLQLIKKERPNLFKDTIPEVLKYYIPRRLVTRNMISQNIFSHHGSDVFLIKGVERHELSDLAKERSTGTSSEIISGSLDHSIKFILLEDDAHFDKVVSCANNHPVHVLLHKDGKLNWLKSSGDIGNLQNYVEDTATQTVQKENDFLETLTTSPNENNVSVCISDTPGMGKSVLLAQIGRQLQNEKPKGSVGFIVISELVEQTKEFEKLEGSEFNDEIFRSVAGFLCENTLGVAYLRKNKKEFKHLLLDGFDEVNASDVQFAYRLVKTLPQIFPDTKIWITTRPHMLFEIEKCLGVLGYNIKAFEEEDQINFLELFWSRQWTDESQNEAADKLQKIAKECLKSIKSKMDATRDAEDDENDVHIHEEDDNIQREEIDTKGLEIAGIPLQCLLIGEVFEDAAIEYCRSDGTILPVFRVNSIADLYQQLVEMKFNKFFKLHKNKGFVEDDLKQAHIYYSMSLLFPSRLKLLAEQPRKLSLQDVFNVGIIESKCTPPVPRFIHRTLAEYFVALYILDSLSTNITTKTSALFLNHVLQSKSTIQKIKKIKLKTQEFRHYVICYFIDEYLCKYEGIKLVNSSITVPKLNKISEACAYGSFEKMFTKLFLSLTMDSKYKQIYSEHFLIVCTMFAGRIMLFEVLKNYRELNNSKSIVNIKMQEYTLLHLAVIRGNYATVEYLVKEEGFKECIHSEFNQFSNLIHDCVCDSLTQDDRIIAEKKHIINYLATISTDFMARKNSNGNVPILSTRLHPVLAKELLTLTKDETNDPHILKFLHSCLKEYKCKDLISIFQQILDEKGVDSFYALWTSDFDGSLLIHKIFKHIEPDETMLCLLDSSGVNFSVYEGESSVLKTAVANQRGKGCISWLVQNVNFTKNELLAAYIQAVKSFNCDAVTTLLLQKQVKSNFIVPKNLPNMFHILSTLTKNNIDQQYIDVARVLIEHGESVNVTNAKTEANLSELMNSELELTNDWWGLANVLFSHIATTTENVHLKQIQFMLRGVGFRSHGMYPLMNACINKKDISHLDLNGNSLLHLIWAGHSSFRNINVILVKVWKMLISKGGDPMILNKAKQTPIDKLMESRVYDEYCIEAVTYVLNNQPVSDISKINDIVVLTIKRDRLKTIKNVCEWYTEHVKQPISSIRGKFKGKSVTMLDMALLSCDDDVLEYLLKTHDCRDTLQPFDNTCIHKCVEQWGYVEKSVKFIILVNDLYPNLINTPNEDGLVPLSMNIWEAGYISHLVKLGANVTAVDALGYTPLHWALKNKRSFYDIKALVECGADVNVVTSNNETPLMISMDLAPYCFKDVFKLLLDNNADPRKLDSDGNTVLHRLPKREFYYPGDFQEIVEHLLKKGYSDLFYLPNNSGMTPIQISLQVHPAEHPVFKLIEMYGTERHQESQTQ